jgi:sugar phosphate permease
MSTLGRQPSSTLSDTSLQTDEKHAHHTGATAQRAEMPIIFEDAELEGDEAAKALKGQTLDFTEADEARVLRKIDWRLMPVMAWACGLQFVDKAALGNAAVFGLRGDLGLVGTQYSWAISIFSFGYAVGAYPSLLAMQRLKMNQFLGVMTVLWGATLLGMLGVSNFAGLMVCRFLLGLCESCLAPGFVQLTGRFYRQHEQPWRFGLWVRQPSFLCFRGLTADSNLLQTVSNGLLPIPMLVCFYGLGHATGGALEPWRYIFLLLGLLTISTGVLIFIVLPDNPANTSWLSPRDRAIAVERVARSQTGIKCVLYCKVHLQESHLIYYICRNHDYKFYQVKEALTDIRVWL